MRELLILTTIVVGLALIGCFYVGYRIGAAECCTAEVHSR